MHLYIRQKVLRKYSTPTPRNILPRNELFLHTEIAKFSHRFLMVSRGSMAIGFIRLRSFELSLMKGTKTALGSFGQGINKQKLCQAWMGSRNCCLLS